MVEGALYFPLVIICLAFVVLMLLHFYRISAFSARMHIELRNEAGQRSGTTTVEIRSGPKDKYRREAERITIMLNQYDAAIGRDYVYGSALGEYGGGVLTNYDLLLRQFSYRAYLIDEKPIVRAGSVLTG